MEGELPAADKPKSSESEPREPHLLKVASDEHRLVSEPEIRGDCDAVFADHGNDRACGRAEGGEGQRSERVRRGGAREEALLRVL